MCHGVTLTWMPPTDPRQALNVIRACIREGRYILDPIHCLPRMKERQIDLADIKNAIAWARGIEPYADRTAKPDSASWRVHGPPIAETRRRMRIQTIAVGVQLTGDEPDSFVAVVTLFGPNRRAR